MAFTTPGTHTIHATFNSTDPNFQSSPTFSFPQNVRGIGTSIVVATTPNPSSVNEPVTFSAVVTSSTAGSAIPQGNVTYKDGTTTLCPQVTLTATGAVPPCTVPLLTLGNHSITAVYVSTTPSFTGGTSTSVNQNVSAPSTTVALTSAPGPSIVDQPVTFTATITPQFAGNTNPTEQGRVPPTPGHQYPHALLRATIGRHLLRHLPSSSRLPPAPRRYPTPAPTPSPRPIPQAIPTSAPVRPPPSLRQSHPAIPQSFSARPRFLRARRW